MKTGIAIFASGSGSNAENIINYFQYDVQTKVELVISNNPNAGVIERCKKLNTPYHIIDSKEFAQNPHYLIDLFKHLDIQFIVLAGYLKLIPKELIDAFKDRIINIHPSLLPKYGGKGMYGMRVHEEVLKNKESQSGITIHLVNEEYDKGDILAQFDTNISNCKSVDDLAHLIHSLEYKYFPEVIKNYIVKFQ